MDSNFKHGTSFEYINLDGKNVGATMRLQHRSKKGEAEEEHCCCINIYVNNNVQGVSNSVLHGSEVKMRDPGVSLYFENFKIDKETHRFCIGNKLALWLFLFVFLVLVFLLLLLLLFSTKVIIFVI
ncbi:hypothetical protein AAHE18_16G117600 [Arachis hypogaea]|uniref:Transmembrane protein n=1 Tax=Arachis hypogaea TaxID=3818 RepID=A0A444YM82_ARAHY|nr:hypothetical protein Ahy_B06g081866 [Arachis hypogaea]